MQHYDVDRVKDFFVLQLPITGAAIFSPFPLGYSSFLRNFGLSSLLIYHYIWSLHRALGCLTFSLLLVF